MLKKVNVSWIVHMFALLHAVVALLCRFAEIEDELLLTMLTMTMALLLCLKKGLNIELTAASIIVVNIIGYLLGNAGANLFSLILKSPYLVPALATLLTTEIIGWSLVVFMKVFKRGSKKSDSMSASYLSWLILAIVVVFFLRLGFIFILSQDPFGDNGLNGMTSMIFSNSFALIILACLNILYVWSARRLMKKQKRGIKVIALVVFNLLASVAETLLVSVGDVDNSILNVRTDYLKLFLAALITQITVYCLVYMINYAITARSKMQEARGKAHDAQYRYQILKRQVDPHFLFNSLNVLDCLVCEEKTEQASTYIHKLAGVYRYMLKSEEEQLVTLEDELQFVEKYVDLMMVRFPEGFQVEILVDKSLMQRFVLPCSLQLLIENAVKHNVINVDKPLVIRVMADKDHISVQNNVIPKVTKVSSTGLGQKYIMKQYLDLCGKAIDIIQTENEYKVVLPLI